MMLIEVGRCEEGGGGWGMVGDASEVSLALFSLSIS